MRLVPFLVMLVLAGCLSLATDSFQRVRFEVVERFDAPGDDLAIEFVSSQGEPLASGSILRVRGTYRLASHDRALLYLGLTGGVLEEPAPREVVRGNGTFDLQVRVLHPGSLHVSLYAGTEPDNVIGKRRFELRTQLRSMADG